MSSEGPTGGIGVTEPATRTAVPGPGAASGATRGRHIGWLKDLAVRILAIVGVVAVWHVFTAYEFTVNLGIISFPSLAGSTNSLFFPPPGDIFKAFWEDWILEWRTSWTENLAPSLQRLLSGYLVAAVASISVGIAIGRSRHLREYVEPIIHFVRAIPPPALLPLFLVLLGIDDSMKIALIATGVFPPILLNTMDGVKSIDPLYLETASAFRISRFRRITRVILPAAAPKIFAGLRISMAIAVILMVISELYASTDGVGYRILRAQRQFKMVDLWAGLVMLGCLGALLNGALALIERRLLRWTRS